jgi:hypothetical protein
VRRTRSRQHRHRGEHDRRHVIIVFLDDRDFVDDHAGNELGDSDDDRDFGARAADECLNRSGTALGDDNHAQAVTRPALRATLSRTRERALS